MAHMCDNRSGSQQNRYVFYCARYQALAGVWLKPAPVWDVTQRGCGSCTA